MEFLLCYNTFQQASFFVGSFDLLLFSNSIILGAFFGIFCMRTNLIVMFMCFEIILVSIAFNFSLVSIFFAGSSGLIFAYLILIIAGAESALSLSILTSYFFVEQHIQIEFLTKLKG